jgi:hypothetical protein
MNIKQKIENYRKNSRNLFSTTEAITGALMHSDLYAQLMPDQYKNDPMAAYLRLDENQRALVLASKGAAF